MQRRADIAGQMVRVGRAGRRVGRRGSCGQTGLGELGDILAVNVSERGGKLQRQREQRQPACQSPSGARVVHSARM